MSTISYIKNILTDPDIASITPTSKWGVRNICQSIDFNSRNVVIEYGPGTGVFTKYLHSKLTPESKVILIEKNKNFVTILKDAFKHHPNVFIYRESAETVNDLLKECEEKCANYVLSGIPFSFFDDQLRDRIVSNTYSVLDDGGVFLPYQTFFQKDEHLKEYLLNYFEEVEDQYYLFNLPPMRTYMATKRVRLH
ncbi:phospholipid N-methyltransferase [Bacillus mesophilus]|uniref:Methyltransferase domain-containing protein n=1 Tax=Bacillus mesophilus TaxID=1808955 RepID=A0A6M0Q2X7_9BACI|nr:rRNA adenine N-6-methyltransferase family protein [Bacillus mesophilus]MBM7659828.1 phospholipid N-methyltransferase [Bacillus mesophilus]NEY70687.1 methyltransferase domain-containing protein [Bacillus mesophilus]